MFAVTPANTLKSNLSGNAFRRSPLILAGAFAGRRRKIRFPATGPRNVKIQAVVRGGDKIVETNTESPAESKETNGSVLSASGGEGIRVRAVVTIRKKMKEKLTDKLEDQWEHLVNGLGQGIQIQLISEEIDPG